MPNRAAWEPHFTVGHPTLDAQHQGLLNQCEHLAALCEAGQGQPDEQAFDAAFTRLKALAQEHFATEASLLQGHPDDEEDHRSENEEFDYLVGNVVTADNFSRLELQRFLALWFVGHIAGAVPALRAALAGTDPAA